MFFPINTDPTKRRAGAHGQHCDQREWKASMEVGY